MRWSFRDDAEVVLKLLAAGRLKVRDLIRVRLKADEAPRGYEMIVAHRDGVPGILLDWWG